MLPGRVRSSGIYSGHTEITALNLFVIFRSAVTFISHFEILSAVLYILFVTFIKDVCRNLIQYAGSYMCFLKMCDDNVISSQLISVNQRKIQFF